VVTHDDVMTTPAHSHYSCDDRKRATHTCLLWLPAIHDDAHFS